MLKDSRREMPKQVVKLLLKIEWESGQIEWEIGQIPFVGTFSTDNPFVDPI